MKVRTLYDRLHAMSDIVSQLKKEKEKSLSEIQAMQSKLKVFMDEVKVINISFFTVINFLFCMIHEFCSNH